MTIPATVEEIGSFAFGYDGAQPLLYVAEKSAALEYAWDTDAPYVKYKTGPDFAEEVLPLILVAVLAVAVIAKLVSLRRGGDGPMSRSYKKHFRYTWLLYRIFCVLVCCFAVLVSVESRYMRELEIPDVVTKIVHIAYTILFIISGSGWILGEVFRRDFPWGLFRLIERLFYAGLFAAGSYMLLGGIAVGIIDMLPAIRKVILFVVNGFGPLIGMLGIVALRSELFWIVMYPNKEEREAEKACCAQANYEAYLRRQEKKAAWNSASAFNFWGKTYSGTVDDGWSMEYRDIRKTRDGKFIDEKGNQYVKKDPTPFDFF